MRGKSAITVANERASVAGVLRWLGVELPEDFSIERSLKIQCPFGATDHSDGGVSPAMRLYPDTNSAYCFSCTQYFSPVSLVAKALDVTNSVAAERILQHIGHRPADLAEQWKNAVEFEPAPDKSLMADALKTFCRRVEQNWAQRQFEPKVAAALTRCLTLLDMVRTADDVTLWLTKSKRVMQRALYQFDPSVSERYSVLWEDTEPSDGG